MKTVIASAVLIAALLATGTTALATDRVFLKNGSVLRGEIVKDTPAEIIIDIPDLGRIRVPRMDIVRVEGTARPPDTPDTPDTPIPPDSVDDPPPSDPPPSDSIDLAYEAIRPGETLLVILKGEDRGAYRYSGRRLVALVEVAGKRRMKLRVDPEAGVLGVAWVPREEVARLVRLEGHPDRRILLIEGLETGCWVRGQRRDGTSFAGRLERLKGMDTLSLTEVRAGEAEEGRVSLSDVREIEAFIRSRDLTDRLAALRVGEPVRLTLADRPEPLDGTWLGQESEFYRLEIAAGPEAEKREERLFRGLPYTGLETLPRALREAFDGVTPDDAMTLTIISVGSDEVIRRTVTGRLLWAGTQALILETPDGRERFPVVEVRNAAKTEKGRAARLMARKDTSKSASILSVLPGMPRKDAERILGKEHPGIDVIYEDGKVAKVYCSPPMKGPLFGIELGTDLRLAAATSDLVFDTRIEPVDSSDQRIFEMLSHTLRAFVVKLFVAETDEILAMEIASR